MGLPLACSPLADDHLRLGPITLQTRSGLLAPGISRSWEDTLSEVRADDALAAFESVRAHNASSANVGLPPRVMLGAILNAWHFDPTDDHPRDPEFTWASVLVNDFRDINDDLDTLGGIEGEHFTTLLEWQPRIDPNRTALLAWIKPGPLGEVTYRDVDAAPKLGVTLEAHRYNGVVLSGLHESDEEMEALRAFADSLRANGSLALMLARESELAVLPAPFDAQLRIRN